jgi:hypothetical protein
VLSDELDEDHFHHRHLKLRQQLQRLATQAALSGSQQQRQQQHGAAAEEEPPQLWEDCCSMQLEGVQLQHMLQGWAVERTSLLQLSGMQPPVGKLVTIWDFGIRQHCGCGRCTVAAVTSTAL